MKTIELIAPCHFGTEAVLKREIYDLGYEVSKVEDGRVFFEGDMEAVARANIWLSTAERVLIHMGSFPAKSFTELFDGTANIPWEEFIPKDGKFWVKKASSIKSGLHSIPDIQRIMKKAMVNRLKGHYGIERFPESGEEFPLRVTLIKDMVTIGLDTSGAPLHKRGYRRRQGAAPISETLAAALLQLTPWRPGRILRDPFCGSGTFLIEAALREANRAPGLERRFTAERWTHLISAKEWKEIRSEARAMIRRDVSTDILGTDIDGESIEIARENAVRAGVGELVSFSCRDIADVSYDGSYGFIITNPPYGQRIGDDESLPGLYASLGRLYRSLDTWSMYLITSYESAPSAMKLKAKKDRKIYNGMLRSRFFQFPGPKPPRTS